MDKNDFVLAGSLKIGEKVKTDQGISTLVGKEKLEGEHKVYNIEVYRDHNYMVSMNSIVVHNDKAGGYGSPSQGLRIPQGLTPTQFDNISKDIRSVASARGFGDDIFVMGSRAGGTAKAGSDIDIGIRVSANKFDELVGSSFRGAQNARAQTRDVSIRDGRIQTGEIKLDELKTSVAKRLNIPRSQVQISIIKQGGKFDNGPQSTLSFDFK